MTQTMTTSLLNHDTLATLVEALEAEFPELIRDFIADGEQKIPQMRACLQDDNRQPLLVIAHTLKGASGNIGAMHLYQVCESLEHGLRTGTLTNPAPTIDAIEASFRETTSALTQFLAR